MTERKAAPKTRRYRVEFEVVDVNETEYGFLKVSEIKSYIRQGAENCGVKPSHIKLARISDKGEKHGKS